MYLSVEQVAIATICLAVIAVVMTIKEDKVIDAIEKLVNNIYKHLN